MSDPTPRDEAVRMGERARAITLATWTLDDASRDPDSDMSILARQLLRCIDRRDEAGGIDVAGLLDDALRLAIQQIDGGMPSNARRMLIDARAALADAALRATPSPVPTQPTTGPAVDRLTEVEAMATALTEGWPAGEQLVDDGEVWRAAGPFILEALHETGYRIASRSAVDGAGPLETVIERVKAMPPNGVISRWENVSRWAVIDLLLETLADSTVTGASE